MTESAVRSCSPCAVDTWHEVVASDDPDDLTDGTAHACVECGAAVFVGPALVDTAFPDTAFAA